VNYVFGADFELGSGVYQPNIPPGGTVVGADFGNQQIPSTIYGTKWNDLNGNGVQDGGEPGLAGWTIFDDINGDGILDNGEPSAVTGQVIPQLPGYYVITGVPTGQLIIREVAQAGWQQTWPIANSGTYI